MNLHYARAMNHIIAELPVTRRVRFTTNSVPSTTHNHTLTQPRLPTLNMPLSTTQFRLRLDLVILLPLYMHTVSLFDLTGLVFTTSVVTSLAVRYGSQTLDQDALHRLTEVFVVTYLATTTASYILQGPWFQLITTYLMSWHALRQLFSPENATQPSTHDTTAPAVAFDLLLSKCADLVGKFNPRVEKIVEVEQVVTKVRISQEPEVDIEVNVFENLRIPEKQVRPSTRRRG
jgi:hypothetical protein